MSNHKTLCRYPAGSEMMHTPFFDMIKYQPQQESRITQYNTVWIMFHSAAMTISTENALHKSNPGGDKKQQQIKNLKQLPR
jgi:hypothetical protein